MLQLDIGIRKETEIWIVPRLTPASSGVGTTSLVYNILDCELYLSPTLMERTHKRKRSLQDSPVDLSKMRMALHRLESLKEELSGIEETEEELQTITDHVLALEIILRSAKKPVRCNFLALCAVINHPPEGDLLDCCIGRPQDGWRHEETSRFHAHKDN